VWKLAYNFTHQVLTSHFFLFFSEQREKQKEKMFSEQATDECIFKLLKQTLQTDMVCLDYDSTQHKMGLLLSDNVTHHAFIVPPELRNGTITLRHFMQWLDDEIGNDEEPETKDKHILLLGLDALEGGIAFFFHDQEDDDLTITNNKRIHHGPEMCCKCCKDIEHDMELYGCCDYVYPLEKAWFHSYTSLCKECYLLSNVINEVRGCSYLSCNALTIVKNYLDPIVTFAPVIHNNNQDHTRWPFYPHEVVVNPTSMITEWLPILFYKTSYDQSLVVFVNCNPASKFYGWAFTYQHETWSNKSIHLQELCHLCKSPEIF
jgi:hypothetical protein